MPGHPSEPLDHALAQLEAGRSLTAGESAGAFGVVISGLAKPGQIRSLLLGLRAKGETADEVAGAVGALRQAMVAVTLERHDKLVDTCGTGGGTATTFNISTGAAFIVAGAGVGVAKHGNRSFTSRSGSADVLEALGVNVPTPPGEVARVLDAAGVVFLFAPSHHPAMRHAAPVRKELGVPTIMNLLGPLANPAGVTRQVIGVAEISRGPLMADALRVLRARHALVVHGQEMDEVSPRGPTDIWEVRDDEVRHWSLDPGDHGIAASHDQGLDGGDPADNAERIEQVLRGELAGNARDALRLNAAAALYVSGRGWSVGESLERATESLESGAALQALIRLRKATNNG